MVLNWFRCFVYCVVKVIGFSLMGSCWGLGVVHWLHDFQFWIGVYNSVFGCVCNAGF